MKIRNGFVSNSSTSSFIFLIEDVRQPNSFNLLDILELAYRHRKIKSIVGNRIEFEDLPKEEPRRHAWPPHEQFRIDLPRNFDLDDLWAINHLREEIAKCTEKLENDKKTLEQPDAVLALIVQQNRDYERQGRGVKPEHKTTPRQLVQASLEEHRKTLRELMSALSKEEDKVSLIRQWGKNENFKLVTMTIDQMWDASKLKARLEQGGAIIVDEIRT